MKMSQKTGKNYIKVLTDIPFCSSGCFLYILLIMIVSSFDLALGRCLCTDNIKRRQFYSHAGNYSKTFKVEDSQVCEKIIVTLCLMIKSSHQILAHCTIQCDYFFPFHCKNLRDYIWCISGQ